MVGMSDESSIPAGPLSPDAMENFIEMVGDDPEVLVELLDTFLTDSTALVENMHKALEASDWQTLLRAAHSLKSSSGAFGALHLSSLAAALEADLREEPVDDAKFDYRARVEAIAGEHARAYAALHAEMQRFADGI